MKKYVKQGILLFSAMIMIVVASGWTAAAQAQTQAQEKPRVAVYPDVEDPEERDELRSRINYILTRSGKYRVIPLEALRVIDRELERMADGSVLNEQIAAFGARAGAEYVCVVTETMQSVSVRMVHVESAIARMSELQRLRNEQRSTDVVERMVASMLGMHGTVWRLRLRSAFAPQSAQSSAPVDDAPSIGAAKTRYGVRMAWNMSQTPNLKLYSSPSSDDYALRPSSSPPSDDFAQIESFDFDHMGHGVEFGLVINHQLSHRWSFNTGINYISRHPVRYDNFSLNERAFAIPTRFRLSSRSLYMETGAQFDISLPPGIEDRNTFDIGVSVGVGFYLGRHTELGFNSVFSLTDFVDISEQSAGLWQGNVALTFMFSERTFATSNEQPRPERERRERTRAERTPPPPPQPRVVFSETFEDGGAGWVMVNSRHDGWSSRPNTWMIGNGTAYEGSRSAYITNDNSSNAYNVRTSSISHIYRDITFPTSTTDFTMTFWVRVGGEHGLDDLRLHVTIASATPSAGNMFSSGTRLGVYQGMTSWTQQTFSLPASEYSGQTRRLVFTWRNDSSSGIQPPAAIDNILITH